MPDYTSRELMAIAAARKINDGEIVFCGTGISMLAALDQQTSLTWQGLQKTLPKAIVL